MNKDLGKVRRLMLSKQSLLNKVVHYTGVINLQVSDLEEFDKFYKVNFTRKVCKWNPLTYILYVPVIIGLYIWDGGLKELAEDGLWIEEKCTNYTVCKGDNQ